MLLPLVLAGLLLLLTPLALADWIARQLLRPRRLPVRGTPRDYGLAYEDVAFPSADGLALRGWWIPAEPAAGSTAPVIVLLHPMCGNRQGAGEPNLPGHRPGQAKLDLLQLAAQLHQAHYAVLLFDFRGHGESQAGLCGGGLTEDQDVAGAVEYAFGRAGAASVGLVGFGLGGAAALAAVGRYRGGTETTWVFSGDSEGGSGWTQITPAAIKRLSFIVAVQPAALGSLVRGYLRAAWGPLGGWLVPLISQFCVWRGGYPLDPEALRKFASRVTVPVLYAQSRADPWADWREVQALYNATPAHKKLWWLEAPPGRGEAYAAVVAQPEPLLAFAEQARQRA